MRDRGHFIAALALVLLAVALSACQEVTKGQVIGHRFISYKPAHGGHPGDVFPGLAVEDRGAELVELAGSEEARVNALALLLGELYPGASWNG